MQSPRTFAFAFAISCALLWILSNTARADRIGTPYRGPIELTGSGGGGDTETGTDTSGAAGTEGDGGGGEGGGESGGETGPAPTGAGGGQVGGGNVAKLDGPILWQWWWEYNKDRFLADATRRGRVNMGSSYYWFGGGAKFPPREIEGVSLTQRRDPVFATLKKVLESDKNAAVRAEAAIALGRLGYIGANKAQRDADESDNLVVRYLIRVLDKPAPNAVHQSCLLGLGMSRDVDAVQYILRNYSKFAKDDKPYAVIALGLTGRAAAVGPLLDLLPPSATARAATDENIAAIHALGLFGPAVVPELNKGERDGEAALLKLVNRKGRDEIVMQAIQTLSRLHLGRKTVAKVVDGKCSKNINWSAILAMSNYYEDEREAKAAAKTLETSKGAFKSGAGQDKSFAVLALGELARRLDPNSGVRADILEFLKSKQVLASRKDNYVRACAAIALGCAGDRTAIPLVAELLTDTTAADYVVAAASVSLGLLRATPQADKIRDTVMLKTKWNADARGYAALGIALMGDTTRLGELQDFERNKSLNDKTRRQVTLALALLGDKKNVRAMSRFFSKKWKRNQRFEISNAAYGLAWIRDQSAVAELSKMASGTGDPEVRGMAVIALGYTAARDRVSPLARCYENQSYRNRFGLWKILYDISKIL